MVPYIHTGGRPLWPNESWLFFSGKWCSFNKKDGESLMWRAQALALQLLGPHLRRYLLSSQFAGRIDFRSRFLDKCLSSRLGNWNNCGEPFFWDGEVPLLLPLPFIPVMAVKGISSSGDILGTQMLVHSEIKGKRGEIKAISQQTCVCIQISLLF